MPELAEVEYFRKQWNSGIGQAVTNVQIHAHSRNFRDCDDMGIFSSIDSAVLMDSKAHGKQMLFEFSDNFYLGVHLGMTGKMFVEPKPYCPGKWDHLVIEQASQFLVFSDPRQFGKITLEQTAGGPPLWWQALPPSLVSDGFKLEDLVVYLKRKKKSPIKGVLLMQDQFPGIGNWMADEILWRSAIHPAERAGDISKRKVNTLYREILFVCQKALEIIGTDWSDPPNSWLFNHRWKDGRQCPKTGCELVRETIAGRTTCWSPQRQRLQSEA